MIEVSGYGEVMCVGEFPDEYPEDLLDRILDEGGDYLTIYAYRVAPYGYDSADSYLSTIFNDKKRGVKRNLDRNNITIYSTSFCSTKEAAISLKGSCFRREPKAEIAEGEIKPELGPSRIDDNSTHINWWLFKNARPWEYFIRMEV